MQLLDRAGGTAVKRRLVAGELASWEELAMLNLRESLRDKAAAWMVLVTFLAAGPAMAQRKTEQFPVNRDAGINGFPGEENNNTGASGRVRGAKFHQHAALFDWDKAAIQAFLAANPGQVSATFNIFPAGAPDTDVMVQTVESQNDWVEGDGTGDCCNQFGWTEGTPAVTNLFAQEVYFFTADGPVVDEENSLPWLNDEDGSQFRLINPGESMPNFVNSVPFALAAWETDAFIGVELDAELVEDLINNPNNRGLQLSAPASASNWPVSMKEQGAEETAFLEVTVTPLPGSKKFLRGNSNADDRINLTDPVFTLNYLFVAGSLPACPDAADADDNGNLQITDAVYTLRWLFTGGLDPPAPGPTTCGLDPTPDGLGCASFAPCP
jgi:hypothetical protein